MALSGDKLGKAIAATINALTDDDKLDVEKIWIAVSKEIISHIKDNGEITVNVSTSHASGTINVVGTAAAQSNPAPVASTSGSGSGSIS